MQLKQQLDVPPPPRTGMVCGSRDPRQNETCDSTLQDATRVLELHPAWAKIQVRMRDQLEAANRRAQGEACAFGSRARLDYALERLKIRAECCLELVSDIESQNAFIDLLDGIGQVAWQEYTGRPLQQLRPESIQAQANLDTICRSVEAWITAGYQRLVSSGKNANRLPKIGSVAMRERRLQKFILKNQYTISTVRKAAQVHKADLQLWRHGDLGDGSVMSQRIESVIRGKTPIPSMTSTR